MKKITRKLLLVTSSASVFLGSFLATAKENIKDTSAPEKTIRIGVSLPTQRDIGWVRYREGFEAAAKKYKNVQLLLQVSDQNAATQASQVENLLSQRVDVLILAPQDAAAAASLVEKAHRACTRPKECTRVISFDRLILNSNVDAYVSFDNVKVGELQGQYLTKVVPEGNYVVLSGAPTDNNAKLFKQGAMKYIEPKVKAGKIKIVMEQAINDWQPSEAQRLVENALTANRNNIQAILAPNDNTAGGVIQALSAQKLLGKVKVTGQDAEVTAAQRIASGKQAMTVFKDQKMLSSSAMDLAVKMSDPAFKLNEKNAVNNGKINVPAVLLTPVVVDASNLDKELVQSGYLDKAEVYKNQKK